MGGTRIQILVTMFTVIFLPVLSQNLLSLSNRRTWSSYPGCAQPSVVSCVRAHINMDVLKTSDTLQLPVGPLLNISWRNKETAVFKSEDSEAIFAWVDSHVAGQMHVDGKSWTLEGCGDGCYLWIGQSNDWDDEESETMDATEEDLNDHLASQRKSVDRTTIINYSIMVWYTPQFRALFSSEADMELFVNLIFVETNEGYKNSDIPVRAVKLCVKQHPYLDDIHDSSVMLSEFKNSMSNTDLRNSADAAALLVANFGSCGIAYVNTVGNCNTLSVTKKSCATGYYSFGHELGHNFGGLHNPEEYYEKNYYGHAHLIEPKGSSKYSGYRTILAYSASGHSNRHNYYSNPNVIFPITGTPTGVAGLSNNARIITEKRFVMAACGDELNMCTNHTLTFYPKPTSPVSNNLLTILNQVGTVYTLSVDFYMNSYKDGNIVHLTTDGNCCNYGERIPAVFSWGNTILVSSAVNGNGNYEYYVKPVPTIGQWHSLKVSQRLVNNEFIYEIQLDGAIKHSVKNTQPQVFKEVGVYANYPHHGLADCSIKQLKITTM